jgi:hypothetical protein
MSYTLTDEEFDALHAYFELALTVITDDEQAELVFMEKPLRDMLRDIKDAHRGTLRDDPSTTDPA